MSVCGEWLFTTDIAYFTFYLFTPTSSRNLGLLSHMAPNQHLVGINLTDPSSVSLAEYREWFAHHSSMVGPNITDCSLEEEMNKVVMRHHCNYFCICIQRRLYK